MTALAPDIERYTGAAALHALMPTQRQALADLASHGALRRTRGGYRRPEPGQDAQYHSSRALHALVRLGLARWTDGEVEAQPTDAGRALAEHVDNRSHAL